MTYLHMHKHDMDSQQTIFQNKVVEDISQKPLGVVQIEVCSEP